MKKSIRTLGSMVIALLWLCLALWAWLRPSDDISDSERRKLAQFPKITWQSITNTTFMEQFESYTLDQFPGRDTFRKIQAMFTYYGLGQQDSHGVYLYHGYAAKMEYPLKQESLNYALGKFQSLYDTYLKETGSAITVAIVPDKGYYLGEKSGHLAMDYDALYDTVSEKMPWANHVDLRPTLTVSDYYRTDTHWRQEHLLSPAGLLCDALGVPGPRWEDFTPETVLQDFCGVYYGQAGLPMKPEPLTVLRSAVLDNCTVDNFETGKTTSIYDMEKITARDPYDVFLSGATALLTVHNPAGDPDRELIVFRDSFGSSMVPLLVEHYSTVTVVDIRYVNSQVLGKLLDFHGQDVLFLYSTLVLNSSSVLK